MKTYWAKYKNEHILYKLLTFAIIAVIALFLLRVVKNTIVGLDYPNEILEPADVNFTNALLEGNNPYLRENIAKEGEEPPVNYEYPFLNNICAAAFSFITGGNTVAAHYLVSFIAMVGTAVLGAVIIGRYSRTSVGAMAGFLLLLFCHWRYGYISASPDGFGLFVTMMTLYAASRPALKHRALRCALLTVACFYSKQYYAGVCVAIFIYFWCYSKKEALKYFAWCVVGLASSVAIITYAWPLYWDYSILCLMHGCFHGWSMDGVLNVLNQMKYLAFIFAGMLAVLAVALVKFIKTGRAEKTDINTSGINNSGSRDESHDDKETNALLLFLIQIPVQIIILFFVGRNDGAYLTYFLQLLIPSLVIATLILMEQMVITKHEMIFIGCYGLLVAFTVYFGWTKLPMHMLTEEDVSNWERAYALIDEYREKGEIQHYIVTAYNAIENGDSVFLTGHDGDITEANYAEWREIPLQQMIFPDADEMYEENLSYREVIKDRIKNHELALVIEQPEGGFIGADYLTASGYEIAETFSLQVGNIEYQIAMWAVASR